MVIAFYAHAHNATTSRLQTKTIFLRFIEERYEKSWYEIGYLKKISYFYTFFAPFESRSFLSIQGRG